MNAVQQLEPFLKFILLEPRQSPCYFALRTTLVPGVLQGAPHHIIMRVVKMLMDILPCMQVGVKRDLKSKWTVWFVVIYSNSTPRPNVAVKMLHSLSTS